MMLNSQNIEVWRGTQSKIACYVCRKRKIKCGRELPSCVICQETEQECTYPARAMKRGPKIGSIHASSRKRQGKLLSPCRVFNRLDLTRLIADAKLDKIGTSQLGAHSDESPSARSQQVSTSIGSPNESPIATASTPTPISRDMLNLSFILHPCHESVSPEQQETASQPEHSIRQDKLLATSCRCLGLTPNHLSILYVIYLLAFVALKCCVYLHPYQSL
jgi:hypothetical protein